MAPLSNGFKMPSGRPRSKRSRDRCAWRFSCQNKPHWQMARQALNNVCASNVSEIHAWRTFRAWRQLKAVNSPGAADCLKRPIDWPAKISS